MARNVRYRSLRIYKDSKTLVKEVYAIIRKFPAEEKYALSDQLRRSVTSVPSNIAEGLGRFSVKEQLHFIEIAYGSLMEVETQLDLAVDLGYISSCDFDKIDDILIEDIAKMLSGMRRIRQKNSEE